MSSTNEPTRRRRSERYVVRSPLFWLSAVATSIMIAVGCSNSSPTTPTSTCTAGATVACTCPSGQVGTQVCGASSCACESDDAGIGAADSGSAPTDSGEHLGDGGHDDDGATPASLYSACAIQGSFGWPCNPGDAGGQAAVLDLTDCTDPNYPYCFLGGQGYWCTAPCTPSTVATACQIEDAGCAPRTDTTCNSKGYCK